MKRLFRPRNLLIVAAVGVVAVVVLKKRQDQQVAAMNAPEARPVSHTPAGSTAGTDPDAPADKELAGAGAGVSSDS